jgi:hypothetical protein
MNEGSVKRLAIMALLAWVLSGCGSSATTPEADPTTKKAMERLNSSAATERSQGAKEAQDKWGKH